MNLQELKGVSIDRIPFIIKNLDNCCFVLNDIKSARLLYSILKQTQINSHIILLEFFDSEVYDSTIYNQSIFINRSKSLSEISNLNNGSKIIVTTIESINYKIPTKEYFLDQISISINDKISINSLINKLLNFGYFRSDLTNERGMFSVRGGIIDIFPINSKYPLRVDFLGDNIDSIREFDIKSQISNNNIDQFFICKASEIILTENTKNIFREKFRFNDNNSRIKEYIDNNNFFAGIEWYLGCFHNITVSILNYLDKNTNFIFDFELEKYNKLFFDKAKEKFKNLNNVPNIDDIFNDNISEISNRYEVLKLNIFEDNPEKIHENKFKNHDVIYNIRKTDDFLNFIKNTNNNNLNKIVISVSSKGAYNIILDIFKNQKINEINNFLEAKVDKYNVIISQIKNGFILDDLVIYTEKEIFGDTLKFSIKKNRNNNKDFFKEYSKLNVGDYVIHEKHGISKFEGLVNLQISGSSHDFLSLIYINDDRLYVPVENISLISRYSSSNNNNENIKLDSLKSNNWSNKKKNIRRKLLVVASNLLETEAKRYLNKIDRLYITDDYDEFCKGFNHIETEDQNIAINDVLEDLQSDIPMDRLICGDVGFGKTEVALRASFVVASNLKQVVILAPTTVLVSQHYKSFIKRFENFNIKICQLSRFISQKEIKKNIDDIQNGNVQIIIATHSILSSKIKFNDLGMIIIDEEQHFGVKQKELLKSLNPKAHFMTLSATPIPRTLQLAISGIKDLSMITTAPIDRLPARTIICDFEKETIKNAIEKELKVGGQVFFVTPRVEYLDEIYKFVLKIMDNSNIKVAKASGKTDDLENTIKDFCDCKIDVLICTNIIDSGIDIPNANTILIHRFDLFGLSQLYQLKGRVGRSKRQSFAYFLIDKNKILTENAKKRIEVLSKLNNLGSGFNLSSYDMDIRGSGNLIGDEQSGYIKDVGIELYQSMLQESILMIKAGGNINDNNNNVFEPQINLGIPVYISSDYIEDSSIRLEIYRKIGIIKTENEADIIEFELSDRFGCIPPETKNLLTLIKIKINCKNANIDRLDVGQNGFTFSFFENKCKSLDRLMKFLKSKEIKEYNGIAKIRNDNKIAITKKWKSINERTLDILNISNNFNIFK